MEYGLLCKWCLSLAISSIIPGAVLFVSRRRELTAAIATVMGMWVEFDAGAGGAVTRLLLAIFLLEVL